MSRTPITGNGEDESHVRLEPGFVPPDPSERLHRTYGFLVADIFLGFTAGGATFPFLSLYLTSLGANLRQVALVVGLQAAVGVAAGLFWGRIVDRVGKRRPFLLGAQAANTVAMLLIANVTTWRWLLPLVVLTGLAGGAQQTSSLALMGHLLDGHARRGRWMSLYRMSGSLAFSVAIVLSGELSQRYGLPACFRLAAGVYALAFLVALGLKDPAGIRPVLQPVGFKGLLRGPMMPLLIVAIAFGLPFSAVYSVWPIWVADARGLGRAVFSQLWGLAAFVEVPCMYLAGLAIDRVGRRPTFLVSLLGFGGVYLSYSLSPPLGGLFATQVLRGLSYAAFTATALTLAIDLAPKDARGQASGLFGSAQGLAQIMGSSVGGPLAAALGYRGLFVGAAMTVMGGAAYCYAMLEREKPVGDSEADNF